MQTADYINTIAIVLDPNWLGDVWLGDFTTSYLTERAEIEHLYNLLTETQIVHINEHPAHYEATHSNSEFLIRFEFSDGMVEEFYG